MKLRKLMYVNKALRHYRRELRREKALVEKYGKIPNLIKFYEDTIRELETVKEYIKTGKALSQ